MHRISRIATLGAFDGGSTGQDKERARNWLARKREGGAEEEGEKPKALFCVLPRSTQHWIRGSTQLGKTTRKLSVLPHFAREKKTSLQQLIDQLVRIILLPLKFPLTRRLGSRETSCDCHKFNVAFLTELTGSVTVKLVLYFQKPKILSIILFAIVPRFLTDFRNTFVDLNRIFSFLTFESMRR